jgi:exodeoxyribonuclease V gamma subunit
MLHLHYANRLENLIGPLAASIAQQQRLNPLERVTVVVPNRVVEQFLKHRVAEAIGVAANLEFPFLRRFLAQVLASLDPKIRILDLEELELVLFDRLRAAIRSPSRDFDAPRHYVEPAEGTEDDRDFRTLRLARQLAWLFREYSIARRPMLQKWARDDEREPLSPTEKWQKHLWTSTFDANGYLRREWKDHQDHEWILLSHAFDAIPAAKLKTALPELVHVFGIAYAGPAYIRILSQIGNSIDLHIYTLNPCREVWEDVEQASRAEREAWARRSIKIGVDLDQAVDPFNLCAGDDTPALRLWARPGREYIRMLNELTDCDFDAHFTPADTRPASLLRALQEDILNRQPEWKPGEHDSRPDDGSLRFLACPGIAREAEIVANEIWAMLEHDTDARDAMRFHQIGVIVPDALYADYLPHIQSAFARLHQLPMNVVNRGAAGESPVREAISLLLRLPLGRFTRDEVLHLMQHPGLTGGDQPWDAEQARQWCDELGIYFGADADDLANTYIPADTFHWDQGLRRLALGAFMEMEPDREPRFYAASDAIEYLPCATRQDEVPAAASFIKKVRQLLFDASQLRSYRLAPGEWPERLIALILTHIRVEDAAGERVRERYVEAIESIAGLELKAEPVAYRIAYEIVSARISQLESQQTQFSENGIVMGPLSALRSIPFRAIFLLGLNGNQFPERERRDPMDLRSTRKAGDVTPAERDRYLFLETLLAAAADGYSFHIAGLDFFRCGISAWSVGNAVARFHPEILIRLVQHAYPTKALHPVCCEISGSDQAHRKAVQHGQRLAIHGVGDNAVVQNGIFQLERFQEFA